MRYFTATWCDYLTATLAIDAMTDTRPAAHDYSIAYVFPRLGETGTTREIVDLLDRSA